MQPCDLPSHWRERAAEFRRFAAEGAATAFEAAAAELEEAIRQAEDELLPPTEAARESLSKRRLRELGADGKLKNYGKKGAPLYRRGDLPHRAKSGDSSGFDLVDHVAEIVGDS